VNECGGLTTRLCVIPFFEAKAINKLSDRFLIRLSGNILSSFSLFLRCSRVCVGCNVVESPNFRLLLALLLAGDLEKALFSRPPSLSFRLTVQSVHFAAGGKILSIENIVDSGFVEWAARKAGERVSG